MPSVKFERCGSIGAHWWPSLMCTVSWRLPPGTNFFIFTVQLFHLFSWHWIDQSCLAVGFCICAGPVDTHSALINNTVCKRMAYAKFVIILHCLSLVIMRTVQVASVATGGPVIYIIDIHSRPCMSCGYCRCHQLSHSAVSSTPRLSLRQFH